MSSKGKLGILIPGMGAVATTFIAGTDAVRRGRNPAVGSLVEMGHIPVGDSTKPTRDVVQLAELDDLVFGGWDIYPDTCWDAAARAGVLTPEDLNASKDVLAPIKPMPAVFDREYVRNLDGPNVKVGNSKMDHAEAVMQDIEAFKTQNGCDRLAAVWCGSTEAYVEIADVHLDIERFEAGLKDSHPAISPAMIYAYALIKSGVPYANGAPNLALDVPALKQFAEAQSVPVAGKDFKTGQTLMKTIIAPGLASRSIGVHGWYSTNILGNTDGVVLEDPGSFKSKEKTKLSVLESILDKDANPELYADMTHKVRIDYYPPRGDNKEGWDNIDIFGWLGYPMQIKINFLCRDSILAAPLVLDLALLLDLAGRKGRGGVQDWLSFYFKSPQPLAGEVPVHDLFDQRAMLFAALKELAE